MSLRRTLVAVCALILAACGGGGGGGGGGGDSGGDDLVIGAVAPASVQLTMTDEITGIGRAVSLNAPYTGRATGPIYVVVVDPDQVFTDPSIALFASSATLELRTRVGLPAGRYTQPLVIRACKDAQCTQEYAGSPQTVPKDVTVAGIVVDTALLSFSATAALAPASQAVTVTPPAGVAVSYSNLSYVEYTGRDGGRGLLRQDEVFTITRTATGYTIQPLAAAEGRYVLQTSIGATGYQTKPLTIEYQVGPGVTPLITLLTPAVSAVGQVGSRADVLVTVDIARNVGSLDRALRIVADPVPGDVGWLFFVSDSDFAPVPGLAANVIRHTFRLNACRWGDFGYPCMSAGTYRGTISITGSKFGVDTRVDVPVTFTVQ